MTSNSKPELIIAIAYDEAKFDNNLPVENKPKLKKYGEILPDFKVNSPNLKALLSTAKSRKFF